MHRSTFLTLHHAATLIPSVDWSLACPINTLYRARELADNSRLLDLRNNAEDLHVNYYKRNRHLNAIDIGEGLEAVAELLELLVPLTGWDFSDIKSQGCTSVLRQPAATSSQSVCR